MELGVNLAPQNSPGLCLGNPVMASAGTFGLDGYGAGIPEDFPLSELGAIVTKTTTILPRYGNLEPQMAEIPVGWLNSIGLTNPGIEKVISDHAPKWGSWGVPMILSIAGERIRDYEELSERITQMPNVSALELNISCPNIDSGLEFGQQPDMAALVTSCVKRTTPLPLIVKLTPNVTDIVEVAKAVESAGADSITLINTVVGMGIDPATRRPLVGNVLAGLSGPAIKPIALAAVYRVAKAVDVPIIGVGGITTGKDAIEFFLAGASAVQVASSSIGHPQVYFQILAGVVEYLEAEGLPQLSQLIGAVH